MILMACSTVMNLLPLETPVHLYTPYKLTICLFSVPIHRGKPFQNSSLSISASISFLSPFMQGIRGHPLCNKKKYKPVGYVDPNVATRRFEC